MIEMWRHWVETPSLFEGALFAFSLLAGVLGAILGIGGGVLIVPTLTLLFGLNIRYAVGASIVSVIATSSGAAATYVRDHITNIRVAMLLEVATTIGALGGAFLAPFVPTASLFLIFSLILFYSAWIMFRKRPGGHVSGGGDWWAERLKLNSVYPDNGRTIGYTVERVPFGFMLMAGAGVISGLLGIGSGALKVPAMDSAMRLPIKVSSATSNFMIGVTAAASAGAYYMRGDILPLVAAPVALGVLIGSLLGTRIMMRLQAQKLRKMFLVVLIVIAVEMGLKAFGIEVR
jgi:uncharacterized membrane protein YfcA